MSENVTKVGRVSASPEQFVEIWNASDSRPDAVNRLAAAGFPMKLATVVAREQSYRKKGIKLKVMPARARGKRLNVDALNQLCENV